MAGQRASAGVTASQRGASRDSARSLVRATGLGIGACLVAAVAPTVLGLSWLERQAGLTAGNPSLNGSVGVAASVAIVAIAAAAARRLSRLDRWALRAGFTAGVLAYLIMFIRADDGGYRDAWTYYLAHLDNPYAQPYAAGGIAYPPPFVQLTEPLRALPWPAFLALFTAIELCALWLLAGPLAAVVLLVPFVALEVWYANVNVLLAAAIVLGFRAPAAWSLVLLTKVTPGVGVLWFAFRREWGRLAVALGVTATVVIVSIAAAPDLWVSWIAAIRSTRPAHGFGLQAPLLLRFSIAVLVVAVGARTGRPWTVPLAAAIAMPVLWPAALAILVAVIPLARWPSPAGRRRRAVDWAVHPPNMDPATAPPSEAPEALSSPAV